jgi:hypothetical protein
MVMAKNLTSAIVSVVVGCLAASLTCLVFFYFYKPPPPIDAQQSKAPTASPTIPVQEIPNPEVKVTDVKSINMKTVYKGYFETGNKCAKTYNKYFGNDDGTFSPSSPCTLKITLDRDGSADRSIEISRWDKNAGAMRVIEGSHSTAKITPEQFNTLAQAIVTNEAFKSWREGTMINVSNFSISVVYDGGTRTVMSNVDEKTIVFLQMVDALKQLEKQLRWENAP